MQFIKSNGLLVIAIILFVGLAIVTWKSSVSVPRPSPSPAATPPRFDRLHVTDLQYTAVIAGQEVMLTVQEITHAKRKIGPLTVNPFKELQLTGVNLHLDLGNTNIHPSDSSTQSSRNSPTKRPSLSASPMRMASLMDSLPTIFTDMFHAKDLGFISRVHIHGLNIHANISDTSRFSLIANEAEVSMSQAAVVFSKGVSFESPAHQQLVANEAEWQPKEKRLFIPGTFVMKTPEKEFAGKKAWFTLSPDGALLGPESLRE